MAKIVEVESDMPVGVASATEGTQTKQEDKVNDMLNAMMKRAYILGLSAGMKTMCGSILEKMNQNHRLNPQKQLILLREWCNKNLAKQDDFAKSEQTDQTTNSQNNDEKENKDNEAG